MVREPPILLDLFAGAGGAAMGYHRAGFRVVGVDWKPQPQYPFEFILADAMTFPLQGWDAIHASPPCQAYVDSANKGKHPKLLEPLRARLIASGLPYIIENVDSAPLIEPIRLCGTFFGLRVIRHRHFETQPRLACFDTPCHHWGRVSEGTFAGVYGRGGRGPRYVGRHGRRSRWGSVPEGADTVAFFRECMGIDWIDNRYALTQAIPPVYTEYIGRALMEEVRSENDGARQEALWPATG